MKSALSFLLTLALLICGSFAQSQDNANQPALTVTGQGRVNIPTTLAEITLGVQIQAPNAEEAQNQAAQQADGMVSFLQGRNVSNLVTSQVSLFPKFDSDGNISNWIATNMVSFQAGVEDVGMIIDGAIQNGANRITSVSFKATEEALEDAQQEAIRRAIENGQSQANAAFDQLSLTQENILAVTINFSFIPGPVPVPLNVNAVGTAPPAAARTPIVGGEQEVSASVTIVFAF